MRSISDNDGTGAGSTARAGILVAALALLIMPGGGGDALLLAQGSAPGELWLASGEDREVVRRHRGSTPGDEFGTVVSHDVLPLPGGAAAASLVGAPGVEFPASPRHGGRLVAVDAVTDEVLLRVDAVDLPGAPMSRLGQSLVDLGHVGGDESVHWAAGAPGTLERGGARPAVVILHADGSRLVERDRVTRRRGSLFGWVLTSLGIDREGGSFLEGFVAGAPTWKRGRRQHVGALEAIETESARRRWRMVGDREHGHLGYSLAFVFDQDGDGLPEILVGAPGTRDRDPAGRVHLLAADDGRVLKTFEAPPGAALFGFDVGFLPDVDGDGVVDFVVTAPATDVGDLAEAGSVFVISGDEGGILVQLDGDVEEGWLGVRAGRVLDTGDDRVADLVVVSLDRARRPRPRYRRGRAVAFSLPAGERQWTFRGDARGARLGAMLFRPFLDADADGVFEYAVSMTRADPAFLPE